MNVNFKSAQTLGNRPFKAGVQVIPDHLHGNQKFKQLVKEGKVIILPRDENEQRTQASKDALNARKAEVQRQLSKQLDAARAAGILKPHEITELAKPGTQQKIADKRAAKAAGKKK
jgi:hypothetical protein